MLRILAVLIVVTAVAVVQVWPATAANETESMLAGVDVTIHKSPSCSCCGGYIDVLRRHGAEVTIVDTNDLVEVKEELAVPSTLWSCHTMEIAGYSLEGHVPIAAVERLLSERPNFAGIALPGMPAGAPGMTGVKVAPFTVLSFDQGTVQNFGDF